MKTFTYEIRDEVGIHARPAGKLVKIAKELASKSTLEFNGKSAEMSKLFAIMGLGVKKSDTVTIKVEGPSEEDDAAVLQKFFTENF